MIIDDVKICNALAEVGINVSNIYDLVNTKQSYPAAIPILIELLDDSFTNSKIVEGIVRSLTVKDARGKANKRLLKLYFDTPKSEKGLRWVIGNAFATIITTEDEDVILKIVNDPSNGESRRMFVFALGKIKSKQVEETLIQLLDDKEVALHAISALRRLRVLRALPRIEKLASSSSSGVKKAAKGFLKKFARKS
jgi:HEAT repeat protein